MASPLAGEHQGFIGWVPILMDHFGEPGVGLAISLEIFIPPMPSEAILGQGRTVVSPVGRLGCACGGCVPIVRSLISIPAGITRMRVTTFLLFTLIGSVIWTGSGSVLGSAWGPPSSQVLRRDPGERV